MVELLTPNESLNQSSGCCMLFGAAAARAGNLVDRSAMGEKLPL